MIRCRWVYMLAITIICSCWVPASTVTAQVHESHRTITATVTTSFFNPSQKLSQVSLSVPLWSDEPSPYQELIAESITPKPVEIQQEGTERTAIFQFTVAPGATMSIVEQYTLRISPPSKDTGSISALSEAEQALYLASETGIEADDPRLIRIAGQLTQGKANQMQRVSAIFNFVRDHLSYDPASAAANQGALAGYDTGAGVCTEFAGLFVALARAANIPSRVANGIVLLDEHGHLTESGFSHKIRHQWAEYFDEEAGWIPVDPTFARSIESSLDKAAYVRQNFGDRPITGHSRGGNVQTSRSIELKEIPTQP